MSSNGKGVRKPEPYVASKRAAFQPGDEVVGEYSRERLIRMNHRFVERAIVAGDESLQGTAGLASTRQQMLSHPTSGNFARSGG